MKLDLLITNDLNFILQLNYFCQILDDLIQGLDFLIAFPKIGY